MIRLIASDLDDTLLNEKSDINPRVLAALKAAMAAGCGVTLCSGRMLEAMLPLAERIGVNAPMLLYNGAMAYEALGIVELSERMGCYIQAYPGMGYYCRKVTEYTRRYANSIRVEPTPVGRPLSEWMRENPSDMQKLLLIDTPEGADQAQAALKKAFPRGAGFLKSKPQYIEIAPEGVDKGRALMKLAGMLGLKPEEVMAFGDGQNDVSMIRAAGTGVCMANGCPEARQAADRIAPPNTEDGVAVVIEEYLEKGMIGGLKVNG